MEKRKKKVINQLRARSVVTVTVFQLFVDIENCVVQQVVDCMIPPFDSGSN